MKVQVIQFTLFFMVFISFVSAEAEKKVIHVTKQEAHVYKNIIFDLFDVLVEIKFSKRSGRKIVPFPKAIQLFFALKNQGYKLYLLSNVSRSRFDRIMKKSEDENSEWYFFSQFDGYMTSFKAGATKPNEHIFKRLCDDFFLLTEESFFIDDKQMNVDAAKKLGIDGTTCNGHDHDALIKKLKELNILADCVK